MVIGAQFSALVIPLMMLPPSVGLLRTGKYRLFRF